MIIFFNQIPIFEKGYEKDPAIVAKEAIQEASRNGSDVVLVDTAGRMQVYIRYYMIFGNGIVRIINCFDCRKCQKIYMVYT